MKTRSQETWRPFAVDPCHETRAYRTVRGHTSATIDSTAAPHSDAGAISQYESTRAFGWAPSPESRLPPEVFLG